MTHTEFNALLNRRIGLCREVLGSKATEYASDADRLHNFKESARLDGCTPEQALKGMLLKHWTSISDIAAGKVTTREQLDEKIGDAVNYLILLEAIVTERINEYQ